MDLDELLFRYQPTFGDSAASDSPWALFSLILPNIFALSAFILFILIVAAGFLLVTSSGNPERSQQGKQAATFAIIGFGIIFTSYWVIQIIQIITGIQILGV